MIQRGYLPVLTRPKALRERPEQNVPFETLEATIATAEAHIAKWKDDGAQAEVFDVTGSERVKVWPARRRR